MPRTNNRSFSDQTSRDMKCTGWETTSRSSPSAHGHSRKRGRKIQRRTITQQTYTNGGEKPLHQTPKSSKPFCFFVSFSLSFLFRSSWFVNQVPVFSHPSSVYFSINFDLSTFRLFCFSSLWPWLIPVIVKFCRAIQRKCRPVQPIKFILVIVDLPTRSTCHFQKTVNKKMAEKTTKMINMTNETPYMLPTIHGSGRGGHGFGTGQLPEQSTHEHAPLEFCNNQNITLTYRPTSPSIIKQSKQDLHWWLRNRRRPWDQKLRRYLEVHLRVRQHTGSRCRMARTRQWPVLNP